MRRLFKSILPFAALIVVFTVQGAQPAFVSGTCQKGSNITEPRPHKSRFLQTRNGGIVVIGDNAGYYLNTKVIKRPERELYIVVEYENPTGGKPFRNDAVFKPTAEELNFSSPDFVKGLRTYADYAITVRIFASRNAGEPIDTLKQTVRCYVDTSGPTVKFFHRLKQKP